MYNPFLRDGYLTPTASINRIIIANKNLQAIDLVSSEVFQKNGVEVMGRNLACLLSALKKGDIEKCAIRDEWTEEHWAYWRQTEEIFLAGGITAEPFGTELLRNMHNAFADIGDIPFKITIPKHSHLLSLLGAAKIAVGCQEYKGSAFVFDFGQSYIKRGYVRKLPEKTQIKILEKKKSRHVDLDYGRNARSKEETERLDAFVRGVIEDTCVELFHDGVKQELLIVLSIANYVHKGVIAGSRGGYGKLCLVSDNYEAYLSEKLSSALKTSVRVILVHDGMAAAAMLNESQKNYAVITLGTYMGVGFSSPVYKGSGFPYMLIT